MKTEFEVCFLLEAQMDNLPIATLEALPIATLEALPIEIVWMIMELLVPSDWLSFGIAYDRAYKCILNSSLNSKYRSKFRKFYIKKHAVVRKWAEYYHAFTHNGKLDGRYIDTNHEDSFMVRNYNNGKRHGYFIEYWGGTCEFSYNYYINNIRNGISIWCMHDKIFIRNWRDGKKYGLDMMYKRGELIKIVNHS